MLKLRAYQAEAVKKTLAFLTKNASNSCYNGSDCGTGKTIITIAALKELGIKRALIVCPKVMLHTWKKEFQKWSEYKHIEVIESKKDFLKCYSSNICIISYSLCWREPYNQILTKESFQCLVMDEAHKLKSRKTEQTKFIIKEVWPHIKYKIALSGTPFTSSVTDCYPVFSSMYPGFGTYTDFAETFSHKTFTPWAVKYTGIRNEEVLSKLIRKQFFFRYKREEVLKDLPKRIFNKIYLPKKYSCKEYEKELALLVKEGTNPWELPDIPEHFMGLLRLQGELKVDPITEYVKDLLEQNIPVLLFTLNKSVLAKYKEALAEYRPGIIDGSTSLKDKEKTIFDFQNDNTNLCILNIKAASIGITLTRAQYVVFSQLPFTPSDVEQAISRANRIGAKDNTNISYFVCEKSLDEKVSSMIMSKTVEFDAVFNT